MTPTDYEVIFWIVLAVIALAFLIFAMTRPSDRIDITEEQTRRWEREERKWQ
jgi:hypothetical protein